MQGPVPDIGCITASHVAQDTGQRTAAIVRPRAVCAELKPRTSLIEPIESPHWPPTEAT